MKYSLRYIMLAILSLVLFWDNEVTAHDFRVEVVDDKQTIVEGGAEINGKEILVNVAAKYGYTRQFKGLAQKYKEYGDGFVVVGMPKNECLAQELNNENDAVELVQSFNKSSKETFSLNSLNGQGNFQAFYCAQNLVEVENNLSISIADAVLAYNEDLLSFLRKIDARGR